MKLSFSIEIDVEDPKAATASEVEKKIRGLIGNPLIKSAFAANGMTLASADVVALMTSEARDD